MKIEKILLKHAQKDGFTSFSYDQVLHIKTLPYLSIVQAIEGNYDIRIGNSEQYNTGNKGFFIAPSNCQQTITHNANKDNKRMICRWVFLKVQINDSYDLDNWFDFPIIIPEPYKSEMNLLFNCLFTTDNTFDEYACYYQIISLLSRIATKKERKSPPQIEKILKYIKSNYKKTISIQQIAQEVHLSESHLFSVFKKEMGVSPISYLNNYRLSFATAELLNTDKTIAEIAKNVGIEDSV